LDLNQTEKDALVAFLHTLTGSDIYTNEKWSDPFDEQGDIELIPLEGVGNQDLESAYAFKVFPNPATTRFKIELKEGFYQLEIFDSNGAKAKSRIIKSQHTEDVSELPSGIYTIRVLNLSTQRVSSQTLIKD
ncbi:MAG: T9SS type A sorting domain-containing protein, partial [Flavobacteriales bacterium]|nr:T9SS type A sorting domain-containing protein [Flavobacteriales bacterium]